MIPFVILPRNSIFGGPLPRLDKDPEEDVLDAWNSRHGLKAPFIPVHHHRLALPPRRSLPRMATQPLGEANQQLWYRFAALSLNPAQPRIFRDEELTRLLSLLVRSYSQTCCLPPFSKISLRLLSDGIKSLKTVSQSSRSNCSSGSKPTRSL